MIELQNNAPPPLLDTAGQAVAFHASTTAHAHAQKGLILGLVPPFERANGGPGGWFLLADVELSLEQALDSGSLAPDLSGWQVNGSLAGLTGRSHISVAPSWVCEILTPHSAARDRTTKMPMYARAGVQWAWLVDPTTRVLEAYQSHAGQWTLLGAWEDTQLVRVAPFDAVGLSLSSLWETVEVDPEPTQEVDEGDGD